MQITALELAGVYRIAPQIYTDNRGYFFENYRIDAFEKLGITTPFCQENISRSHRGVVRGLHCQRSPHPQAKLVSVVSGKIFDVAVDVRPNSPTFGKWLGEWLDDETHAQLYIPTGFLHGFYVASEMATVKYSCSEFYYPEAEHSCRWDDPDIGIEWPLDSPPIVSIKDQQAPFLKAWN